MDISFIIPIYNTEVSKLLRCFESINKIEDVSYEVLLIDDGSESFVRVFCEQYVNKCTQYKYFYKKNGGVSSARNYGIKMASADYVAFVDSDDEIMAQTYNKANISSLAELIIFDMSFGVKQQKNIKAIPKKMYRGTITVEELMEAFLYDSRLGGPVAKLFKKKMLDDNGFYFDTNMIVAEDADFLCKVMSKAENIYYVPESVYIYDYTPLTGQGRIEKFPFITLENYYSIYCKKLDLVNTLDFSQNDKLVYIQDLKSSIIKIIFECYEYWLLKKIINSKLQNQITEIVEQIEYDKVRHTSLKLRIYYFILKNHFVVGAKMIGQARLIYQRYFLK